MTKHVVYISEGGLDTNTHKLLEERGYTIATVGDVAGVKEGGAQQTQRERAALAVLTGLMAKSFGPHYTPLGDELIKYACALADKFVVEFNAPKIDVK